jgi:hypothetical protein
MAAKADGHGWVIPPTPASEMRQLWLPPSSSEFGWNGGQELGC